MSRNTAGTTGQTPQASTAVNVGMDDLSPAAKGLTPRQRRVLEVIRESVETRGYPPSVREIGEGVGLTSTSSASHQLKALEHRGCLGRAPTRPRGGELRGPGERAAFAAAADALARREQLP